MHENSRELAQFFNDDGETTGGLAFARTDSLERQNLAFFHTHFQTSSRRPSEIVKAAGFKALRIVFNPSKTSRAKFACEHCGRPFTHRKRFNAHVEECAMKRATIFTAETTNEEGATCDDGF